jgi:anti-sigma B factor antagonist
MTHTMIKPSLFEIEDEWDGEQVRIVTAGELDLATSPQLEHEMRAVIARGAKRVTIDMTRLTFVDSSGLRVLIGLYERSMEEGWELALTHPSEQARAVFRISGAEEHLPFVDGLDDVSKRAEAVSNVETMDRTNHSDEEQDPPFVEESLA